MSLTYIVLNLLLQNELKRMKMQSDTGQFQQHHPLPLLLQVMKAQTLARELANDARELKNIGRELDIGTRELEIETRKLEKYLFKE